MRPSAPCSLKRLRSVFRSLGKPANLAGGVVRPHRNSMAHGKPPQFAILNHASIDSGIQRIGISRLWMVATHACAQEGEQADIRFEADGKLAYPLWADLVIRRCRPDVRFARNRTWRAGKRPARSFQKWIEDRGRFHP